MPTQHATLERHGLVDVPITDPDVIAASGSRVHRGLRRRADDRVDGGVLHLTADQLARADEYEVDDYARRRVLLADGDPAWAYVAAHPLTAAQRIGVVGDSIAYGRSDPAGGWTALLGAAHIAADETSHRLFNLSMPGATLAGLRRHALPELDVREVDTVLVAAGLNDLAGVDGPARTPAHVLASVQEFCERLEREGRRPVVVGPTWVDGARAAAEMNLHVDPRRVADYRVALLDRATATLRDVIDPWSALLDRSDLLTDGVHPGPEGHAAIWRTVRPRA